MLRIGSLEEQYCAGVSRREVLQVGAAAGAALSLPAALRAEEAGTAGSDLSVLVVFLRGGVAHLDTWDMKPDATSAPVRGEFKPISTTLPGLQMCELLPRLARQAHHLTVLRGASHNEGEHDRAMQWMLTGQGPGPVVYPNPGAVLSRYRPGKFPLPGAVHVQVPNLGNPQAPPAPPGQPGVGAGVMGAAYAPFMIRDIDRLQDMEWGALTGDLTHARLDRRRSVLQQMDRVQRQVESSGTELYDHAMQRAFAMVTSPEVKQAFNLENEPAKLRDQYGRHEFGQSCLLGRRLIEAGVRYVQVNWSARGWEAITAKDDFFTRSTFDSHFGHFPWLRRQLPRADDGLGSLIGDMADRGLLKKTLVLVLTEFGRGSGINQDGGREHWSKAFTILAAGGGLESGRILGATSGDGMEVTSGRFGPTELINSIYHLAGLDVPITLRLAGLVPGSSEGIPGLV